MSNSGEFSQAKNCAFRLIKFRLRSEKEIRDKLSDKEFEPVVIDEVVAFLKRAGLLDDVVFARLWVESRLKRKIGPKRLRYELKNKGIAKVIIDTSLEDASANIDEEEAIRELVAVKLEKMQKLDINKIKSRLYGFLLRRGYSQGKVMDVIREVMKPGS